MVKQTARPPTETGHQPTSPRRVDPEDMVAPRASCRRAVVGEGMPVPRASAILAGMLLCGMCIGVEASDPGLPGSPHDRRFQGFVSKIQHRSGILNFSLPNCKVLTHALLWRLPSDHPLKTFPEFPLNQCFTSPATLIPRPPRLPATRSLATPPPSPDHQPSRKDQIGQS
jgi:hypothetical protein